jgi:hypothetical protein
MPVLSYTCESLQLLFEGLGLALSKPISRLLAWLLLEKTRTHLFRLTEKLPGDETTDRARRQRIRRFLSNSRIDVTTFTPALWPPLLLDVDEVMLSMDRTEWHRRGQAVNVLKRCHRPQRDNLSAVLDCSFSSRRDRVAALATSPHSSSRCTTMCLVAPAVSTDRCCR